MSFSFANWEIFDVFSVLWDLFFCCCLRLFLVFFILVNVFYCKVIYAKVLLFRPSTYASWNKFRAVDVFLIEMANWVWQISLVGVLVNLQEWEALYGLQFCVLTVRFSRSINSHSGVRWMLQMGYCGTVFFLLQNLCILL